MPLRVITTLAVAAIIMIAAGCGEEQQVAEPGDTVAVEYVGSLPDGSVFDSTNTGEPIEFTIGTGQVIPGFDSALTGATVGEHLEFSVPPEQGYGMPREELTHTFPADSFPPNITPEVGLQLEMQQPDGRPVFITITDIDSAGNVTIDANHRLAGKTLHFSLDVIDIIKPGTATTE